MSSANVKPNATIATRIGLTIPIKEKTIKTFVARLGQNVEDGSTIVPKQVPKMTILAVSAIVEKVMQRIIGFSAAGRNETQTKSYTVIDVPNVNDSESDSVLQRILGLVSRAKIPQTNDVDNEAGNDSADTSNKKKNTVTREWVFSCSNQISKNIKLHLPNVRVSSDALELIQYYIDEFYKKLVQGAFLIAQNARRKTISKNDIIVALKIMTPEEFSDSAIDHINQLISKYDSIEKARPQLAQKTSARVDRESGLDAKGVSDTDIDSEREDTSSHSSNRKGTTNPGAEVGIDNAKDTAGHHSTDKCVSDRANVSKPGMGKKKPTKHRSNMSVPT